MIRWDGGWKEARDGGARLKGMIRWDERWTSCGRAKAAEIEWEEARNGGARSKDGTAVGRAV